MRAHRWLGFALAFAWAFTVIPGEAGADGGAYVDLDRTHFLVGSTGHAKTYVAVPANKQHLFERGPFYLYVTPARSPVTKGQPLPSTAVRVATMSIEHERGTAFELSASFTVPALPGDSYALGVCNDPCTISGFREPLTGTISIVQTAREAELLNDRQRMMGRIYALKRQIRKGRRTDFDLERRLSYAGIAQNRLSATIDELERKLANARADEGQSAFPVWLATALAGGVLVGAAGGLSWRHRRAPALDVPAMVEAHNDIERPKLGAFR